MNSTSNKVHGGMGPVQPHVSNLPRRRPKGVLTNATDPTQEVVHRKPLSSSSKNASGRQTSYSSSSNKTNYLTNSQLPIPTTVSVLPSGPSFNSTTTSSSQNHALSGFTPNDNGITRPTTPSLPRSPVVALPKPKGHIQPHADNVPRRKKVQLNPEHLRRKLRQEWAACTHKQEVLKGSGIWVVFDLKDLEVCGFETGDSGWDDLDERTRRELDGYQKETEEKHRQAFRHIIRVVPSLAANDGDGIEESGQTVNLFISKDCSRRDDGVPCVSAEQLFFISRLIQDHYGPATTGVVDDRRERVLITVPCTRTADAMALAIVACRAAGIRSIPSTNTFIPLTGTHSRAPARASSPELSSSHIETSFPPILPMDPMTQAGMMQSPALTFLARMYDLEDLDEVWKGALSVSGLELVNEVIEAL